MKKLRKCGRNTAQCDYGTLFGNVRCRKDGHSIKLDEDCKFGIMDVVAGEDEHYRTCERCNRCLEDTIFGPKCKEDGRYVQFGNICRQGIVDKDIKPQDKPVLSIVKQNPVCPRCGFPGGYNLADCLPRVVHTKSWEYGKPYSFNGDSYQDLYHYTLEVIQYYSKCPSCGYWRHVEDHVVDKVLDYIQR